MPRILCIICQENVRVDGIRFLPCGTTFRLCELSTVSSLTVRVRALCHHLPSPSVSAIQMEI
jgi:hypothetical protein